MHDIFWNSNYQLIGVGYHNYVDRNENNNLFSKVVAVNLFSKMVAVNLSTTAEAVYNLDIDAYNKLYILGSKLLFILTFMFPKYFFFLILIFYILMRYHFVLIFIFLV